MKILEWKSVNFNTLPSQELIVQNKKTAIVGLIKHHPFLFDLDMFSSYNHSLSISRLDGMIGHNVNVANDILAFLTLNVVFGNEGNK